MNREYVSRLSLRLNEIGFEHFSFSIIPNPSVILDADLIVNVYDAKMVAKGRALLCSDSSIESYLFSYLENHARKDIAFTKKMNGRNPYVWLDSHKDGRKEASLARLKAKYNIKTKVSWRVPMAKFPMFIGCFVLYSSLERSRLVDIISLNKDDIFNLLNDSISGFDSSLIYKLNPYYNYKIFSPISISIAKLLSSGKSTKEICDELSLTERGVEYHVERLKHQIKAKNRPHLVSRAYQVGLLSVDGNES